MARCWEEIAKQARAAARADTTRPAIKTPLGELHLARLQVGQPFATFLRHGSTVRHEQGSEKKQTQHRQGARKGHVRNSTTAAL